MKKTLIASAVAAVTFASGAAMAAEMPKLYGNIQLAYANSETEVGSSTTTSNSVFDNGSTVGLTHSHEVAPGVTGFLKMEFDVDAVTSATQFSTDEAYFGVKGDFGSVQFGSDDTVYEWVKIVPDEAIDLSGDDLAGVSESSNLQYTSPKLAGMATVGITLPSEASINNENHMLALGVKAAPVENLNVVFTYAAGREEGTAETGDALGLSGSYSMDNITVAAQFQMKDADSNAGVDDKETDLTTFGLRGTVGLGATSLSLAYRTTSTDADTAGQEDTISGFWLQALHNVSDNMYFFAEYVAETTEYKGSNPDQDVNTLALGGVKIKEKKIKREKNKDQLKKKKNKE
jgi:predicted porin